MRTERGRERKKERMTLCGMINERSSERCLLPTCGGVGEGSEGRVTGDLKARGNLGVRTVGGDFERA